MQFDLGEVATIGCVTLITIVTIIFLEGGGTEIAAAGIGGLVGYLTKSNNGGSNEGETIITHPSGGGTGTDDS